MHAEAPSKIAALQATLSEASDANVSLNYQKGNDLMRIHSLKIFSKVLIITALLFAAGGLLIRIMGKHDVHGFNYFGVVFSVMGIGFYLADKNFTEISNELKKAKENETDVNSPKG